MGIVKRGEKYFIKGKKADEKFESKNTKDVETNEQDKDKCIKAGMIVEAKEHPSFDAEMIERIVKDHLLKDPDYYKEESK
jgi:hypothetical protein